MDMKATTRRSGASSMFDPALLKPAMIDAFKKLHPRMMIHNPVMFVVELVTGATTLLLIRDALIGYRYVGFDFQIVLWLWITVLFANFAEAVAEGRGKAQAASLRSARTDTMANRITANGTETVPAPDL